MRSARAEWARFIAQRTPALGETSPSRSCRPRSPRDPDRLKRFEQEARAAGVLNHPNITLVYDIGSHDGAPYVVQELLEGETLRAELAGGRFRCARRSTTPFRSPRASTPRTRRHRPPGPEAREPLRDARRPRQDPRLRAREADAGRGLRQPFPSSRRRPSRARHGDARLHLARADQKRARRRPKRLFALGAVLYETLSGQRPFRGDSAGEIMATILKEDLPASRHQPEHQPRPRAARAPLSREERRTAIPIGEGPGLRPGGALRGLGRLRGGEDFCGALADLAQSARGRCASRPSGFSPAGPPRDPTEASSALLQAPYLPSRHGCSGRGSPPTARRSSTAPRGRDSRPESSRRAPAASSRAACNCRTPGSWRFPHRRARDLIGHETTWKSTGTLARVPLEGGAPRELLENVSLADWSPTGAISRSCTRSAEKTASNFPSERSSTRPEGIESIRFSPRGDRLAISQEDGTIATVDLSGKVTTLSKGWSGTGTLLGGPKAVRSGSRPKGVRAIRALRRHAFGPRATFTPGSRRALSSRHLERQPRVVERLFLELEPRCAAFRRELRARPFLDGPALGRRHLERRTSRHLRRVGRGRRR